MLCCVIFSCCARNDLAHVFNSPMIQLTTSLSLSFSSHLVLYTHTYIIANTHKKSCDVPPNECPHRGCLDTRKLLLHVQSCPYSNSHRSCPMKGCNETKKLLAHYHKCKVVRSMKQEEEEVDGGGAAAAASCLVCSLLGRYAKTMMEREEELSSMKFENNDNVHVARTSLLTQTLEGNNNEASYYSDENNNNIERKGSGLLMPPPPPRTTTISSSNYSNDEWNMPSSSSAAMNGCTTSSKLAALATVASVLSPCASIGSANSSLLGKSVDSSNVHAPFPILRRNNHNNNNISREGDEESTTRMVQTTVSDEEVIIPTTTTTTNGNINRRRRRAESYDERKTRVKFAPGVITKQFYFDTAIEEHQHHNTHPSSPSSRPRSASDCSAQSSNRPRSASDCSSDNSGSSVSGSEHLLSMDHHRDTCETIDEEGSMLEQPVFDME